MTSKWDIAQASRRGKSLVLPGANLVIIVAKKDIIKPVAEALEDSHLSMRLQES